MPTVIDSLKVVLGLDSKDYEKGIKKVNTTLKQTGDEAQKAGKKIKKSGKDGAEGYDQAAKSAAGLFKILAGAVAFKKIVIDTIQTNAELYRFSRNLQQSARDVSAFGNAVEITGGDAKAFQGTLSMLSRSQTELQMTGQSNLLPFFARFHVAMMNANGTARKGTDILLDFADKTKGMDRTTRFNVLQSMGIDEGTANAMLEGRQALEALIAKQKEHGAVTDKQAENSEKTRRSMTEAAITARTFKNEVSDGLSPAIKTLTDLFTRLDEVTGGWSTTLVGAISTIGGLTFAFRGLASAVEAVVGGGAAGVGAGGVAAAAGGGIGLLGRFAGMARGSLGLYALTYSKELNTGEGAELAKRQAMGATITNGIDPQKFFESKGWTREQAAGIVANLKTESSMNPSAIGDNGSAYGIAQWHPDRQANFRKAMGKDIKNSSLSEQLEFVNYELTSGSEMRAGGALRTANNAGDAAAIISKMYERPRERDAQAASRAKLAMMMMGKPGASGIVSGAATSASSSSNQTSIVTSIGEVKVYTQASDAQGIAKDIRGALNIQFPAQANTGIAGG